jgi:hypothetical protein
MARHLQPLPNKASQHSSTISIAPAERLSINKRKFKCSHRAAVLKQRHGGKQVRHRAIAAKPLMNTPDTSKPPRPDLLAFLVLFAFKAELALERESEFRPA